VRIDIVIQTRARTSAKWRKQFAERLQGFVEYISCDANVTCEVDQVTFEKPYQGFDRYDWYIRLNGPGGDDIDDPSLNRDWMELIGHYVRNKVGYVPPGRIEVSFRVGMGSSYLTC
jgi:hypothetical protein